jgi:hypothetical protein
MRMAFIWAKRIAARYEARPIMSLLLSKVRLSVTEFDSTIRQTLIGDEARVTGTSSTAP